MTASEALKRFREIARVRRQPDSTGRHYSTDDWVDALMGAWQQARHDTAMECAEICHRQISEARLIGGQTGCAEMARNEIRREFGLEAS